MRLKLAADAVVLSEHHASQVPRFGLNSLAAEVKLLRRDLELLRAQMARPTAAEGPPPAPEDSAGGDEFSGPMTDVFGTSPAAVKDLEQAPAGDPASGPTEPSSGPAAAAILAS